MSARAGAREALGGGAGGRAKQDVPHPLALIHCLSPS